MLPLFLQAPPAEAKVAGQATKFEKNQAYQAELLASIKARTGKDGVYGSLNASPTDVTAPEVKIAPLKFDGGIEKTKIETPASTPAPNAAVPATAAPPKAEAPAAASSSSFSSYTAPVAKKAAAPAAAPAAAAPAAAGDNKGVLAVGAIAVLGAGAAIASNSNGEGGEAQAAAGAAPVAAAAGAGASDVPANVASARAWIGAWKKKHNKA